MASKPRSAIIKPASSVKSKRSSPPLAKAKQSQVVSGHPSRSSAHASPASSGPPMISASLFDQIESRISESSSVNSPNKEGLSPQPTHQKTSIAENGQVTNLSGTPSRGIRPPLRTYQTFAHSIASKTTPTLLYSSRICSRFVAICYASAGCAVMVGATTVQNYMAYSSNVLVTGAGFAFCALWGSMGLYFSYAPFKMIKSITAIPANAPQGTTGLVPSLEIQPYPLFWSKPSTIKVPLSEVNSELPIAPLIAEVRCQEAALAERSGFSKKVAEAFRDCRKMFLRNNFARIRIARLKNFKLDLDQCYALDDGEALDKLINVDTVPMDWTKGLVKQVGR